MYMKTRIILLMCLLTGGTLQAQEYLREVLNKLESIRSASYQEERLSYLPYESKPRASYTYQVHEYRNPNDTTIGSSFVEWTKGEEIAYCIYDGQILAYIDQEPKEVEINDFSMYPFPYRPVSAPFFNYTESLLRYFSSEDFELVAIETWGNSRATLQSYAKHNGIQYKFLEGNDKVVTDYHTGGAAPFFFLIDQDRIVRKVIRGYSVEDTDKEIIDAVESLL